MQLQSRRQSRRVHIIPAERDQDVENLTWEGPELREEATESMEGEEPCAHHCSQTGSGLWV